MDKGSPIVTAHTVQLCDELLSGEVFLCVNVVSWSLICFKHIVISYLYRSLESYKFICTVYNYKNVYESYIEA